jgi:apolipoprotein N-acyltransferase
LPSGQATIARIRRVRSPGKGDCGLTRASRGPKPSRFAAEATILAKLRRLTGWRADLAAAALGITTALALPPVTLAPALLIGIPGLLALIDGSLGWRGALRRGFVFGLAHHLAGLYWVTDAVLVEAAEFWWAIPLAVPALAAVLAVFIAIPCGIARLARPGWRRIAVLAGAWVLGDLGRQFALTGFPWNPLGSATEMPGTLGLIFMQPAAWVGVGGLTLATVLLAATPAFGRRALVPAIGALAAWAAAGTILLVRPANPPPGLVAVIAQGNVSEIEHRDHWQDRNWDDAIFERYLSLTRTGIARARAEYGPDARLLVVWPETASPYWLQQDDAARQAVAQAATGAVATLAGAARKDGGEAHNSLIVVMPNGTVGGFYDKHHLVPYGEYFPSYLPIRLGERGWDPGPSLKTLHIPGLPPLGPLICYEAAFPAQVAVETDRPAALVNITNDSWFGTSAGPRQHLAAARMRAVEEGLPLVRAANTGISAVIDSHGRLAARLGLDHQGVLIAPIPGFLPRTPESRMGLAAPGLLALFSCAIGFGLGTRREMRDSSRSPVQIFKNSSSKAES